MVRQIAFCQLAFAIVLLPPLWRLNGSSPARTARLPAHAEPEKSETPEVEKSAAKKADSEKADSEKVDSEQADSGDKNSEKADSEKADSENGTDDKGTDDKGTDDKGTDDKGAADKGTDDKGAADKPADEKPSADEPSEEKGADDKPAGDDQGASETPSPESTTDPDANADSPGKDAPPAAAEGGGEGEAPVPKRVIGATATVLETSSGFMFRCRVDTGAKSCSLHVEKLVIEGEDKDNMEANYGKVIRFLVKNGKGKEHWISSKIATHVLVKNSAGRERRYKVPLELRWKDCQKTVLVTLNDRSEMEYPMLIGRNFLAGDFVVDIDVDSDDEPQKK